MSVTAAQVKQLREATGVGMMECKKALVESNGDYDKAIIWLRERGMSRAAKKAGRAAAEGLVVVCSADDHRSAAMVEVNCETDFAAKNEEFLAFAEKVGKAALAGGFSSIESLVASSLPGQSTTIAEDLSQLIARVGENMSLRRVAYFEEAEGFVIAYSHMGGKIGSLVSFKGPQGAANSEIGADLAMHVVASSPKAFDRSGVSTKEIEAEKDLLRKQLLDQGKPAEMIEKILQGQINKFYKEITFLDQPFVKEPKVSVQEHIKKNGDNLVATNMVRFQLGEGIEVVEKNFKDEVAEQLKS